jgi:hypothetical protein
MVSNGFAQSNHHFIWNVRALAMEEGVVSPNAGDIRMEGDKGRRQNKGMVR